jgi:protein tyrosine phosphatase (PTP) superfamily phosphohydrolase (DUF442 family)
MDALNTHQVFGWLWTSGQLSEQDIGRLPPLGIEAVINLATPASSNALAGEAERVAGQGIAYFQIPVEWENPRLEQIEIFFGLLDALEGRRLWLHCAMNMRVSAFVYLYRRLVRREDAQAAAFPMSEVWEPNEVWQAFIDKVLSGESP